MSEAQFAKAEFAAIVGGFGLPVHLARAIVMLTTPAPMRDLADQLEERGLVTRAPGADRRVKLLALTDAGRALRDKVSTATAERSVFLRRLDDAERKTFAPLLQRLVDDEAHPHHLACEDT